MTACTGVGVAVKVGEAATAAAGVVTATVIVGVEEGATRTSLADEGVVDPGVEVVAAVAVGVVAAPADFFFTNTAPGGSSHTASFVTVW